jgi:hypothetical protein
MVASPIPITKAKGLLLQSRFIWSPPVFAGFCGVSQRRPVIYVLFMELSFTDKLDKRRESSWSCGAEDG